MSNLRMHQCDQCDRRFKREDHLTRHKLSHGKAKYECDHPGCGMTFHRKDVLQRHFRVHEPDAGVKRRRPRRGVEPKPFVRGVGSVQNGTDTYPSHGLSPTTSEDTDSVAVDDDLLAGLPRDTLTFCCLNFQHTCMKRFAFIHCTSIDMSSIEPEKLLAMAALGGSVIPEYRSISKEFFVKAQQAFTKRRGSQVTGTPGSLPESEHSSFSAHDLSLFQAQILLIEFALWSSTTEDRDWASNMGVQLGSSVVPGMVQHVKSLDVVTDNWLAWAHREEWIRTLWAFYCTGQKAKLLLTTSFSTLDLLRDRSLPAPDPVFQADTAIKWQQSMELNSITTGPPPTFGNAFFALMSPTATSEDVLAHVSTLGRHVLLAALLDLYHSALLLPSNFDSSESYQARDLTHFKPHTAFAQALTTWRRLWWINRSALYQSGRSADLQNVLLLNYLEIFLFEHEDSTSSVKTRDQPLVSTLCGIFCDIAGDGVFDVATRTPWLVDGASHYYGTQFASASIRWLRRLRARHCHRAAALGNDEPPPTRFCDALGPDDHHVYMRFCGALRRYARDCLRREVGLEELMDVCSMEALLIDAWATILNRDEWVGLLPP